MCNLCLRFGADPSTGDRLRVRCDRSALPQLARSSGPAFARRRAASHNCLSVQAGSVATARFAHGRVPQGRAGRRRDRPGAATARIDHEQSAATSPCTSETAWALRVEGRRPAAREIPSNTPEYATGNSLHSRRPGGESTERGDRLALRERNLMIDRCDARHERIRHERDRTEPRPRGRNAPRKAAPHTEGRTAPPKRRWTNKRHRTPLGTGAVSRRPPVPEPRRSGRRPGPRPRCSRRRGPGPWPRCPAADRSGRRTARDP